MPAATARPRKSRTIELAGTAVPPGRRATIELPVPRLYTHTSMAMPVHVVNGRRSGPRMFVSAALHGDELNGVEIVRQLLGQAQLKQLRGSLIAVPIVNVHGCIQRMRELPDRRDPNRAFPGSAHGSLASRLAHLFMTEIVQGSDYGIDLHTGTNHRSNLPQIRACLDEPATEAMACAFGAPVVVDSSLRDGSLREAAREQGVAMLLYEAGEALRFDELAIRAGVRGVINVMRHIGMLRQKRRRRSYAPIVARSSTWARAPASGILRPQADLGATVQEGDTLGVISDPFGEQEAQVLAHTAGVIIGRNNIPLIHEGEALFHIARFADDEPVAETLEAFHDTYGDDTASSETTEY